MANLRSLSDHDFALRPIFTKIQDRFFGLSANIWQRYYRYHTLQGKKRTIVSNKEHGNSQLLGTPTKVPLFNYL